MGCPQVLQMFPAAAVAVAAVEQAEDRGGGMVTEKKAGGPHGCTPSSNLERRCLQAVTFFMQAVKPFVCWGVTGGTRLVGFLVLDDTVNLRAVDQHIHTTRVVGAT